MENLETLDAAENHTGEAATVVGEARTGRAWIWFALAVVAFSAVPALLATPLGKMAAPYGVMPAHGMILGVGFAAIGCLIKLMSAHRAQIVRIESVMMELRQCLQMQQEEMGHLRERMPSIEQFGEVAAHQFHSTLEHSVAQIANVAAAVDHARACVDAVRNKLEDAERARLTLAGTMDSMNARIEKIGREMQESKKVNITNDLEPLRKAMAAVEKELLQKRGESSETAEYLNLTMGEMEKRLMIQLESAVAELKQAMEQAPPRAAARVVESAAPLMSVSDMESPSARDEGDSNVTISEGPREARSVLSAIDKLRALRGS